MSRIVGPALTIIPEQRKSQAEMKLNARLALQLEQPSTKKASKPNGNRT